jgi:hypothetical protein
MVPYLYSSKLKVESKYLYLTWCAFEHQVRKSSLTLSCRGRNRAMPKKRGKVAHSGRRLAKHYGWSDMFCGLSALDKFQSGPYASRKSVVTLDYAVLVSKSW